MKSREETITDKARGQAFLERLWNSEGETATEACTALYLMLASGRDPERIADHCVAALGRILLEGS